MKNILYLAFLLITRFAFAQTSHQLKISPIDPLFKMAHLSYEYQPASRSGLELMLRYNWGVDSWYSAPGSGSATQQTLTTTLTQKIYLFCNQKNWLKGWFAGLYIREDWLLFHPDKQYEYLRLRQNYRHWRPNEGNPIRLGMGIVAGYKCRFGKHFFVEASLGCDSNLFSWIAIHRVFYFDKMDIAGILGAKAGWRF